MLTARLIRLPRWHQSAPFSTSLAVFEKQKVVILGVGWGGFRVAKDLDKSKFDVTIVSPRNHFLFTPLLPSTTVGTLEFRWRSSLKMP